MIRLRLKRRAENSPEWETYLKNEGFIWLDFFFIDLKYNTEFEISVR